MGGSVRRVGVRPFPEFCGYRDGRQRRPKTEVLESVGSNGFLQAVDVSAEFLSKPIGMYGFMTGWLFGLAFAVVAMHLGLSAHTKEYLFKSADFLLTKPFTRGRVFLSKLSAVTVQLAVIGATFWAASLAALSVFAPGFDFKLFIWIIFLDAALLVSGYFIYRSKDVVTV
jgi:ABC-2 type transport system permease protein